MDLYCRAEEAPEVVRWQGRFQLCMSEPDGEDFHLRYQAGVLSLERGGDRRGVFVDAAEIQRRLKGDFALGRACGIRRGAPLEILDATAGLGIDGLALALAGQHVLLVERNVALWALLDNLLERLALDDVRVELGDCAELIRPRLLSRLRTQPQPHRTFDVVYFDPMFPPRTKTALPGKRMQYLAELLKDAEPFDETLVECAKSTARSRVVLKRRLKDPVIGQPDWLIRGRAVRYDVYRGLASEIP